VILRSPAPPPRPRATLSNATRLTTGGRCPAVEAATDTKGGRGMAKKKRKRRARAKSKANHGKRPNT